MMTCHSNRCGPSVVSVSKENDVEVEHTWRTFLPSTDSKPDRMHSVKPLLMSDGARDREMERLTFQDCDSFRRGVKPSSIKTVVCSHYHVVMLYYRHALVGYSKRAIERTIHFVEWLVVDNQAR